MDEDILRTVEKISGKLSRDCYYDLCCLVKACLLYTSGFIGPFPPPLLIRVIKLSLLSYQVFPVCQYGFSGFAEKSVAPSENCADVPPVQKLYMTFFL